MWTAAHQMCVNEDKETLLRVNAAELNKPTENGNTALHLTVATQSLSLVSVVLQAGCCVNTANNNEETPLHWASSKQNASIIALLLAHGACPTAVDEDGNTPLHWACQEGNFDNVRVLLPFISPDEPNDDLESPLEVACINGYTNVVEYLLPLSEDTGDLLFLAARHDQAEVVKLLLHNGFNSLPISEEDSPLHIASVMGNDECVQLLMETD